MTPRVLVIEGWQDAGPEGRVELSEADHHHLAVVLRRRPGDPIELFDGQGRAIRAVLEADDARATTVGPRGAGGRSARGGGRSKARDLVARLAGSETREPPSPLSIVLAQGISSHERMDWTIEKAVEVGVGRLVPLQTARGTTRQVDERRRGHWARIIASACAQSGRNTLPSLEAIQSLDGWLAAEPLPVDVTRTEGEGEGEGEFAAVTGFVLEPTAPRSLADALGRCQPTRQVWLACGPEAGFDPLETKRFVNSGWQVVGLGPRTLRTETAALIAMAIIQSQWGDLR